MSRGVPHPSKAVEIAASAPAPIPAPLIVKIGGALLESADQHLDAFRGLVALHQAVRARGGAGIVLVHGGGAQVDRQLKLVGIETPRIEGIRVTTREAIDQVVGVLAGSAHMRLLGILAAQGARCVGLGLSDGGLCQCRHTTKFAFDAGEVGEITGGDGTVAHTLLSAGFMPVVNSIGLSAAGEPLNVNADEAACAIARVVGASGLVLLTDVAGVLDASKALIPELDAARIEALIADGTISGGMIPKVRNALDAAAQAGCPATIASWRDPAAIATGATGTRILSPLSSTALV
ncbi:MAG: acetylglutamate kinase [Planctomycetaceae bacterium]|nr:acetylglutamate kinase [Planctomycetaceae bacterium]